MALCFQKKPELSEIPRRNSSWIWCCGELNLSLGLKYLGSVWQKRGCKYRAGSQVLLKNIPGTRSC